MNPAWQIHRKLPSVFSQRPREQRWGAWIHSLISTKEIKNKPIEYHIQLWFFLCILSHAFEKIDLVIILTIWKSICFPLPHSWKKVALNSFGWKKCSHWLRPQEYCSGLENVTWLLFKSLHWVQAEYKLNTSCKHGTLTQFGWNRGV